MVGPRLPTGLLPPRRRTWTAVRLAACTYLLGVYFYLPSGLPGYREANGGPGLVGLHGDPRQDEAASLALLYGTRGVEEEDLLFQRQSMREEDESTSSRAGVGGGDSQGGAAEMSEEDRVVLQQSLEEMKEMLRDEDQVWRQYEAQAQRQRLSDAIQFVEDKRQKERKRLERLRGGAAHPTAAGAGTRAVPVRAGLWGVARGEEEKYCCPPGGAFRCGDGAEIDCSRVQDDFCDCADGSDERGTSACAGHGGRFFCRYDARWIPASHVGDGLRDCGDGADEWAKKGRGHLQTLSCPHGREGLRV